MKQKRNKWGTKTQYKKICKEIWEERLGRCEKCGKALWQPRWHNFHHEQGRREHFLDKETIRLLCYKCHSEAHGIPARESEWLDQ